MMRDTTHSVVVTTTSTQRPELLRRTYESWQKNLQGVEWGKLIINFDPNPAGQHVEECLEICHRFFDDVAWRETKEGSFGAAVKWIWGQVQDGQTVLHLEDDWLLRFPVNAGELVGLLRAFPQVAFRAYNRGVVKWFVLAPSFIRGRVCREIARDIDPSKNPEQWIRTKTNWDNTYVFPEYPRDKVLIQDIGRWYNRKNRIRRNGLSERQFTSYVVGTQRSLPNKQAAAARAAWRKYGGIHAGRM